MVAFFPLILNRNTGAIHWGMIGYVRAFDTPWRDKWKERWCVTDPQESRFPFMDSAGGFPLPPLICTVDMQRPSQGKAAEVPRLHMFGHLYKFAKLNTTAPFPVHCRIQQVHVNINQIRVQIVERLRSFRDIFVLWLAHVDLICLLFCFKCGLRNSKRALCCPPVDMIRKRYEGLPLVLMPKS